MTEWKDISTAPRDGTAILVALEDVMAVAKWCDVSFELFGFGWRDAGDIGWGGLQSTDPSHWQPLPKPPESE